MLKSCCDVKATEQEAERNFYERAARELAKQQKAVQRRILETLGAHTAEAVEPGRDERQLATLQSTLGFLLRSKQAKAHLETENSGHASIPSRRLAIEVSAKDNQIRSLWPAASHRLAISCRHCRLLHQQSFWYSDLALDVSQPA